VTRLALVAALIVAIAAPAASAARYSFGRQGGNIEPYTVAISTSGAVTTSGPVKVGRTRLTARQLRSLANTVAAAGFSTLPATTFCLGTLPDFASGWVAVGTQKVSVRGSCSPRFTRVWKALAGAVRVSNG
jgi:hypothetical protein